MACRHVSFRERPESKITIGQASILNLETAVEREKAVQEIYVHREFLKLVVTLWVIRDFKSFLGA